MANKQSFRTTDIRDRILSGASKTADPIRQTLSPKGLNVIFRDSTGQVAVSNDGATIIKSLRFKDQVEEFVLEIIRNSSLQTNLQAGDGSSSSVVLSAILVKEGMRLVENGMNGRELERELNDFASKMVEALKKNTKPVKTDKDLFYIASVSSSGDKEIADNVVKTIKTAGTEGMVFIEPSNSVDSDIKEDTGFNINAPMFSPELRNNTRSFSASYLDVPVLITDKRLYYAQEAETILSTVLKAGYKEVVIVAKDFIGDAPNFFIANHTKGTVKTLLIKIPQDSSTDERLADLAIYLGGHVVSEKTGSIVDNLTIEDFTIAKKAYADGQKTIIARDQEEKNPKLVTHIETIRKELKKHGKNEKSAESKILGERLACLTTGMVTIRVGGNTPIEVNEKIYRYEDAVNATREAMKSGYLVGGGIGLLNAYKDCKFKGEMAKVYRMVGEALVRQIAENCSLNGDIVLETIREVDNPQFGFNALSGQYEDLIEAGVIDPFKVTEMVIRNSVSVANAILSTGYFIIDEIEDGESKK
jgi:chaperonin GroEL